MPHIVVYLNEDGFGVDRDTYLAKVEEARGDWIIVTEWIESVGVFLGSRPRTNPLLPFTKDC